MDFIFLFDRRLETALHDVTLDPSSDKMDSLRDAMRQTNNKRNLYEIACLHPQQNICLLAVEALDNLGILEEICETLYETDVWLAARQRLDYLKNEQKSVSTPRSVCPQFTISLKVWEKLHDAKWPGLQETFIQLPQVGDFDEWDVTAKQVLGEQDVRLLYRAALAAKEQEVAVLAVRAISNEYVLAAITASYKASADTRKMAASRIEDKTVLMALLDCALDWSVACTVVDRIPDEQSRSAIARRNRNTALRIYVVKKLTAIHTLEDMALHDRNAQVRHAAMQRVDNARLLTAVALYDSEEWLRLYAIDRLMDKKVLAQIAKREKKRSVRKAAQGKLYQLQKEGIVL